jgi:Lrp/AsnC family transcriptional regulator, regulator for asnA, asnC and gidA
MTFSKQNIDDLDKRIIFELQEDARRSFKTIAKKLNVAEGTIRNRIKRLIDSNILKLQARVNPFVIPHKVAALIGVNLKERDHEEKMRQIEKIPSVTSVWNATGRYDLFFEVMVNSLQELNEILFKKELNKIGGIDFTETFVILSSKTKFFKLS